MILFDFTFCGGNSLSFGTVALSTLLFNQASCAREGRIRIP
jgi:hypothetical protein